MAPAASGTASVTTKPMTCAYGATPRTRVAWLEPHAGAELGESHRRGCGASARPPSASPVVPLEHGSSAGASRSRPGAGAGASEAISSSKVRTSRPRARGARRVGQRANRHAPSEAPGQLAAGLSPARRSVAVVLTPVTVPPAAIAPSAAPAQGATLGAQTASTSPGREAALRQPGRRRARSARRVCRRGRPPRLGRRRSAVASGARAALARTSRGSGRSVDGRSVGAGLRPDHPRAPLGLALSRVKTVTAALSRVKMTARCTTQLSADTRARILEAAWDARPQGGHRRRLGEGDRRRGGRLPAARLLPLREPRRAAGRDGPPPGPAQRLHRPRPGDPRAAARSNRSRPLWANGAPTSPRYSRSPARSRRH